MSEAVITSVLPALLLFQSLNDPMSIWILASRSPKNRKASSSKLSPRD